MRGIAAIVVFAVHCGSVFEVRSLFANGPLAVDLFFCLSGFVVARAYDSKIVNRDFWWLMRKRIVRLYPMIVFAIALSAALAYVEDKSNVPTLGVAALVLFPISLVTGGVLAFPLDFPMWSLFFELVGSAGYGVDRNRIKRHLLLLLVFISGCVLASTLYFGHLYNFGVGGRVGFLVGFPRMIYPFAIGVLFARTTIKVPSLQDWQLALILVLIFAIPSEHRIYSGICCIIILPAMVLFGSSAKVSFPAFWEWLGRVSYPIYLLHAPILEIVRYLFVDWSLYLKIPLAAGLTMGASIAALTLYDEPLRARLSAGLGVGRERRTVVHVDVGDELTVR